MNPAYTLAMLDRADLRPYLNDEQFEFRRSVNRVLSRHASPDYIGKCDEEKRRPSRAQPQDAADAHAQKHDAVGREEATGRGQAESCRKQVRAAEE